MLPRWVSLAGKCRARVSLPTACALRQRAGVFHFDAVQGVEVFSFMTRASDHV